MTIDNIDWQAERDRFDRVALPHALRAAKRVVRGWHSRKKDDAIQEFLSKTWDQWKRLLDKGRDPEPLLWPLLYWAKKWVYQDRRLSGRPRNLDIQDYRSGMTQHLMDGRGQLSPHDRADRINGFLDWSGEARTEDPGVLLSALETVGMALEEYLAA